MKIITSLALFLYSMTILTSPICRSVKYRYKIKGEFKYFKGNFCKESLNGFELIYSENCSQGQCHLAKASSTEEKGKKNLIGKGQFGSPQYLKCRSINGRPEKVFFEKNFWEPSTMLCFSKVDNSIFNTASLYQWRNKTRK